MAFIRTFFILSFLSYLATNASEDNSDKCELYIANSTIPNAGLGIFSAIERKVGEPIGESDICIPIMELDWHHKNTYNPFGDYVWAGEVMGMKMEVGSPDIEALCPGLDCMVSSLLIKKAEMLLCNEEYSNPSCCCSNVGKLQSGADKCWQSYTNL